MASRYSFIELPPPKDLSHHFSRVTKNREASQIKRFYKYFQIPGIGNLAGGLPNANYFPYDTLEASAALPNRFKPTPNDSVEPPDSELARSNLRDTDPTPEHVVVPHDSSEKNILRKIDLATALQYGQAQGYPPLYSFIREFAQTKMHPNVPYQGAPEIILTCGSTDGFSKSLECFTNVWDASRDWIREREGLLCEEFAYMNAIQAAKPRGINIVPVAMDAEGMLPHGKGGLKDVLENWDHTKGKRPHLMYTVTMGQNPTSGLLSVARRKQIYAICQKFDVLIIEDDPYFYIQFPSAANSLSFKNRNKPASIEHLAEANLNYQTSTKKGKSSGSKFLDSLVPSYLSMDVDGRVIRLDTFSKTIAPGCRLGWVTAQPAFIERLMRIAETSTQAPSGFVQSLVAELLIGPNQEDLVERSKKSGKKQIEAQGWQMDGWIRWLEGLRGNYERRMQIMAQTLEDGKYTSVSNNTSRRDSTDSASNGEDFEVVSKSLMYTFPFPMAGMFLWMHVNFSSHPLYSSSEITPQQLATALWLFQTKKPYLILSAPGSMFSPLPELAEAKGYEYFRLCFAAVEEKEVERCSKNLVRAFQDFWEIKDVKKIKELLKEMDEESDAVKNNENPEDEDAVLKQKLAMRHAQVSAEMEETEEVGAYFVNPIIF